MEHIKIPSLNNLHDEKNQKEKLKKDAYVLVLNKCIEKIIYTNKHTDQTYIFFDVPKFLIEYPFYDMKSCILYIMEKLIPANYIVSFIAPFYLYIDWSSFSQQSVIPDKLKLQTKELLKKFPNATKVVYEYSDKQKVNKKKVKK
jgi:hypothetical protein